MKRILITLFASVFFFGCGQEEKQPLPDLPKIAIPQGVAGNYAGRLPIENAKAHQIQLKLDSLGVAYLTEHVFRDSLQTTFDTLTYKDSAEVLSLYFKNSSKVWHFKKSGETQYVFLNPVGEPFLDPDSNFYTLFRILKTMEK